MYKNTIKNLAICALIVLTVYQTVQLWFDDSSNRPFFYSLFQQDIPANQSENIAKLVTPFRIITNISSDESDKRVSINYTDLAASGLKKAGDNALEQVLKRGDYAGFVPYTTSETDMPCIEYEYAVSLPTDVFVQQFKQKSNMLTSRIKQFDSIIIIPYGEGNRLTASFVDKSSGNCYKYSLAGSEADQQLLMAAIEAEKALNSPLYYKIGVLENSPFIYPAFWDGDDFKYNNVTAYNPYGELTLANVERFVGSFFDNPAAKQFQIRDGVFTFSDEKTVVKYYPSGVLEYSVHEYFSAEIASSFASSFSVAMNMIDKDKTITNDFYLSSYTQEPNGFVFTFNYCVNDFPLYFSRDLRAKTGMDSMIEISVTRDSAKYKRYVSSYELSDISSFAREDFYSALESAFAIASEETTENPVLTSSKINLFDLGYKIDDSDTLYLSWFIDINGQTFVQSTE